MASYGIDLYFDKRMEREKMLQRITSLAGCKPVPDEPGTYYFEDVHVSLSNVAHSKAPAEIRQSTGLEVGSFSVEIYVNTAADEAFEERWDRALDLLASGEDAIAVHESEWILLIQRDGQLTLDNSGEVLSPYYRDYLLSRRPAKLEPLGRLG